LGYSTQSKGYRVYSLENKKLIISRDVMFDEDASYNWETNQIERKNIYLPAPAQQQEDEANPQDEPRQATNTAASP